MWVPLRYNLRSLAGRPARTTATIVGIAAVVTVYVVMSSVAATMRDAFHSTGRADEAVVLQAGALNPEFSSMTREAGTYLRTLPRVAHNATGEPLVSPELYLASRATAPRGARDVMVRGVAPISREVYRDVTVTRGAFVQSGRRVLVGAVAAHTLGDLHVGETVRFEGQDWTVAGILAAGGRVWEQEIWVDLDELAAVSNHTDLTNYVVRVDSAGGMAGLLDEVNGCRRFPLQAMSAPAAYARVGGMNLWMAALGQFIALVIALGAVFGGMNTMFGAVAHRSREIGILRVLGFRRPAILVSFLAESIVIGAVAGVLGAAAGWGVGHLPMRIPFLVASSATVGLRQMASGVVLAAFVALLGGALPAIHAARMRVIDAIR